MARGESDGLSPTFSFLNSRFFFTYLFTVKYLRPISAGYRTAIADCLGSSDLDISKILELNRLLASFHRDRPVKDKAIPNWDLFLVMLALTKPPFESLRKASLKIETFKTVFSMTLASGKRRGEVHSWTFRSRKHKTGWKKVTVFWHMKVLMWTHILYQMLRLMMLGRWLHLWLSREVYPLIKF